MHRALLGGLTVAMCVVPGVRAAGWDEAKLAEAHAIAGEIGSHSWLLVDRSGCVVDSFGDLDEKLQTFSVRKSFVSALYGPVIASGAVSLDTTLGELGIDDRQGLTEAELQATVRDLLGSRSGVYHPATYETPGMIDRRPARGSHAPGEHYFYNNWDFNAQSAILEQVTGERIGDLFERLIAEPNGMSSFETFDVHHIYEAASVHPATEFWMDAWDQARFGLLFLHGGRRGDVQIVPETWVAESTEPHSDLGMFGGYGYSWWVAAHGDHFPMIHFPDGTYSARGNGEQLIFVMPHVDAVWVHRARVTRPDQKMIHVMESARLLSAILGALSAEDEVTCESSDRIW